MSYFRDSTNKRLKTGRAAVAMGVSLITLVAICMYVFPMYNIWQKEQSGRAQLAEAEFSKQTKLEEAKANLEAEKLNAQAEVERAKGAAESIKIEGGGLSEEYIRYLWVRQQSNLNDKTVIYIPTEAGLPILESGKR